MILKNRNLKEKKMKKKIIIIQNLIQFLIQIFFQQLLNIKKIQEIKTKIIIKNLILVLKIFILII